MTMPIYSVSGCAPHEDVRLFGLSFAEAKAWVAAYKRRNRGWAAYMHLQSY